MRAYEDDLCPGCGWPRTYSMHKEAAGHWTGDKGTRCYGCEAKGRKERAAAKAEDNRPGLYFTARPDKWVLRAMFDPTLDYSDQQAGPIVGASGLLYDTPTTD